MFQDDWVAQPNCRTPSGREGTTNAICGQANGGEEGKEGGALWIAYGAETNVGAVTAL